MRRRLVFVLALFLLAGLMAGALAGCGPTAVQTAMTIPTAVTAPSAATSVTPATGPSMPAAAAVTTAAAIREDGRYNAPADVALYLHTFGRLPRNYITKSEAARLGWSADKGNLWLVTDRMSIGGDVFGNREGLLPARSGRVWRECDVSYQGGFRGGERIVYSNDGLIYYSKDHYASFTRLY